MPSLEGRKIPCIDKGGILRCRAGVMALNTYGIDGEAFAAGDITKQQFQGAVPGHVVALFSKLEFDVVGEPIQRITPEVLEMAEYWLVYCGLDELPEFMDRNDPRLHHLPTRDVKAIRDIVDYERAVEEAFTLTEGFVLANFPEKFAPEKPPNSCRVGSSLSQQIGHDNISMSYRRYDDDMPFPRF